jgi:hypothetical protein
MRANMRWAKLKGADCRTVINDAGEREFTDLSETEGLTPVQIESHGWGSGGDPTRSSHLSRGLARAAGEHGGAGTA